MRSTNSATSSAEKALPSESMGTACRTLANFFAGAAGINVGGIEEIDAKIERLPQERTALWLVKRPRLAPWLEFTGSGRAVSHASKADTRNLESGIAESYVVHDLASFSDDDLLQYRYGMILTGASLRNNQA